MIGKIFQNLRIKINLDKEGAEQIRIIDLFSKVKSLLEISETGSKTFRL